MCDNASVVKTMRQAIKQFKEYSKSDPIKKEQLKSMIKALKNFEEDCSICKREGNNDVMCINEAVNKLYRQLPFIKKSVYPWKNYDWDYGNFIDNNYSAEATGSSPDGKKYLTNIAIFLKLFKAFLTDANPNNKSVAGGTNSNSDFPIYGCKGLRRKACKAFHKVKSKNQDKVPYKNDFFKKKLDGENSSSYYVKIGSCPIKNTSKEECSKKGYDWVLNPVDKALSKFAGGISAGSCHMPRYAFINNQPGLEVKIPTGKSKKKIKLGKLKGYVPSLTNDVLSLAPGNLVRAYSGKNIKGYLEIQKCPPQKKIKEGFDLEKKKKNLFVQTLCSFTLTVIFIILIYRIKKYII